MNLRKAEQWGCKGGQDSGDGEEWKDASSIQTCEFSQCFWKIVPTLWRPLGAARKPYIIEKREKDEGGGKAGQNGGWPRMKEAMEGQGLGEGMDGAGAGWAEVPDAEGLSGFFGIGQN